MKKMTSLKSLVLGAAILAGFGIGNANAQPAYRTGSVTPVVSTSDASSSATHAKKHHAKPGVVLRGGYNVGPTSVQNVPGCQGPASFCNLYFGS
jgi:hypothetical protein